MTFSNLPSPWFYSEVFGDSDRLLNRRSRLLGDWLTDSEKPLSSTRGSSSWMFPVDIKEDEQKFEILADIPGISEDELEITIEKNTLSIKGERKFDNTEKEGDRIVKTERGFGKFHRQIHLPESADAENVSAKLKDGVLNLVVQKRAEVQPRRIALSASA